MKRYDDARQDFESLFTSDEKTKDSPVLHAGWRRRVESSLELVLVNPETWDEHRELLEQRIPATRTKRLLESVVRDAIVRDGLSVLNDEQLAALALNRNALWDLRREIYELLMTNPKQTANPWVDIAMKIGGEVVEKADN